jgi:hypothetical protein
MDAFDFSAKAAKELAADFRRTINRPEKMDKVLQYEMIPVDNSTMPSIHLKNLWRHLEPNS